MINDRTTLSDLNVVKGTMVYANEVFKYDSIFFRCKSTQVFSLSSLFQKQCAPIADIRKVLSEQIGQGELEASKDEVTSMKEELSVSERKRQELEAELAESELKRRQLEKDLREARRSSAPTSSKDIRSYFARMIGVTSHGDSRKRALMLKLHPDKLDRYDQASLRDLLSGLSKFVNEWF